MTTTAAATERTGRNVVAWHGLTVDETCKGLGVDPGHGLSPGDVERRRAEVGPNRLAAAATEPGWHAFLRQYRDLMQLVLVGAAIVSIAALQEFSTGIVILGLTVLNAVLGLNQEGKAAESVAALQKMLVIRAHVRRGSELLDVPAEELVPGDVVVFEAGDKIPADGRLLVAATLEIEEAALTGESLPVLKAVDTVTGDAVPLGDRLDMAYMNSTVTRGRGEMVVTATGMSTEVGQISRMLGQVEQEKTPLTRQLDQLTVVITTMAAIALALVVVLGLIRGESFDDLFLIGISLAIAAIPTGLPAVVTTVLSLGTQALAAKGAIVKRLRSVETLGSTSAICSDKTGTLTLNQMTARQLVVAGSATRSRERGTPRTARSCASRATPTCRSSRSSCRWRSRTTLRCANGEIVGDPTEAALVVLAAKGGVDVDETRRVFPRVAEVPFDSDYKLMATFHEMEEAGRTVVRCFVKGAPDVLLARSSQVRDVDGAARPAADVRDLVLAENDRLAGEGLRVLAVASRDLDPGGFRRRGVAPRRGAGADTARARRDRRSAPQGGPGCDRALQGGGHPRPHDHRRPCDDSRGHRRTARDRRTCADGCGVRRAVRRGARPAARRDRRGRARRARGQGAPGRPAEGARQRRRDDRRRRQRRAGPEACGHRRRDGDHGHRGDEGSRAT